MMTPILFVASTLCTFALALQQATNDLCFAADVRLALANDALYFMGGLYTFEDYTANSVQNYIYSIPLNKSFSTTALLSSTDYLSQSASGGAYYNQGAFFTDPNITTLYSFAGFKDPSSPVESILAYDVKSGQWSNPTVSGGSYNFDSRAAAIEATSEYTDLGLSFFSGGWVDIPGMIRFDASDPGNLQWTNETDNNPPLTLDGSMEFVRYGKSGSLIEFGGYNKDYIDTGLTGWSYDSRDMSIIGVYDVASSTWYNVTAEGSIPSNRSAFCTAVSAAPDDTSMQITMYGGWDLWNGHSMSDIYVLTIPSFQWIQVTDQSNVEYSLFPGNTTGRDSHKCKTFNDRTLLSVGGYVRAGSVMMNTETCNSSWPVVRALDTSTYKFLDSFDPEADAYYVPDAVTEVIGGDGQGRATMTAPSAGFTNQALNELFAQTVKRYNVPGTSSTGTGGAKATGTASATSSSSTSTKSSSSSSSSSEHSTTSSSSHTGAIAGGVVAGIAILAVAAGCAYLLVRRRQRSQQSRQSVPPPYPEMQTGSTFRAPLYGKASHENTSELPSSEDVVYPAGGAYFKPGSNSSPALSYHRPLPPAEVDGGYRGVEADSYSHQMPGRTNMIELP